MNKMCSGRDWWLCFYARKIPQLPRQPSLWHSGDKESISMSFFRVTDWQGQRLTTSLHTDLQSPYPSVHIKQPLESELESEYSFGIRIGIIVNPSLYMKRIRIQIKSQNKNNNNFIKKKTQESNLQSEMQKFTSETETLLMCQCENTKHIWSNTSNLNHTQNLYFNQCKSEI